MKKLIIVFFLGLVVPLCSVPRFQDPFLDTNDVSAEIKLILDDQKAAWNAGDLKGYMSYYWNSEDLTFQSGPNRFKGWQQMLSRYEAHYPPEKRGTLDFTDIEVHMISGEYAYVLGRWKLVFLDSSENSGLFTLIFRKMPVGWKIILDHTS